MLCCTQPGGCQGSSCSTNGTAQRCLVSEDVSRGRCCCPLLQPFCCCSVAGLSQGSPEGITQAEEPPKPCHSTPASHPDKSGPAANEADQTMLADSREPRWRLVWVPLPQVDLLHSVLHQVNGQQVAPPSQVLHIGGNGRVREHGG